MDRLTRYRELIPRAIRRLADLGTGPMRAGVDECCVFDTEHDHYMLISVGWLGSERISNTIIYVRIRNGKIWIEEDWTDRPIATDLVEEGVPKSDIVLGFQPPRSRPLTEFAAS
jgi:XisI protein